MTTGDIALLVSIFSVAIAGIALGWNIYRDLQRPKLKVNFSVNAIVGTEGITSIDELIISATNLGPGKILADGIILKRPWYKLKRVFLRKDISGFLFHDYEHPMTAQFPCEMEVGHRKDFFLRYHKDCFLKDKFSRIGIRDSFGRIHWAPKKRYRLVKKDYEKKFGSKDIPGHDERGKTQENAGG